MQNATLYPSPTPKATLLIAHGMAEHQARYREFAEYLANHGIVVMTFDHLGHGQNALQNHQLGYMGNPNPHERMIANVMTYARQLAENHPNVPHFILGHSMGSFITRCILGRFGGEFAGAILMGTSAPNPIIAPLIPLTGLLNAISPKGVSGLLNTVLNKVNNLPFIKERNLHNFNWLNSNPAKVQAYINDPLCGFEFTNNGLNTLFNVMQQGTRNGWSQTVPKALPMLFVSGADDSIGKMGKGIPQIVNCLQKQDFVDVQYHQYAGMRHEILHEAGREAVYTDILNWLNTHSEPLKSR